MQTAWHANQSIAARARIAFVALLAALGCASVQQRLVDNSMRFCDRGQTFACKTVADYYRLGTSVDGDTVFEPDAIVARDRYLKTCSMPHEEGWSKGLPDGAAQSCQILLGEHFVAGAEADAIAARLKEMGIKPPSQDAYDAAWKATAAISARVDRQQIMRDQKAGPDDFIYGWGMAPGETAAEACPVAQTRGLLLLDCMKRTEKEKSFSSCDCVKVNEKYTFCKTRVGCRFL